MPVRAYLDQERALYSPEAQGGAFYVSLNSMKCARHLVDELVRWSIFKGDLICFIPPRKWGF